MSLNLDLMVHDAEIIAELCNFREGSTRDEFAIRALRLGVLALKQAQGQVDTDAIRSESERLLENMENQLGKHSDQIHDRMTQMLKEYFDPESGRFQERVDRLIKQDGELELLLKRQLGSEDSELCKTLSDHFGEDSLLMKWLGPDQGQGLLAAFQESFEAQLKTQRDEVLKQFSLDEKEGALSRFIAELTENQGQLSAGLQEKLDTISKEFSLDEENSALSRLVNNVDRSQKLISREFSLDEDSSALSRLKKMLEHTNESIHKHLSLDDENSALARLKRGISGILTEQQESNLKFQEEVKTTLSAMVARKEEMDRSTRHGLEFEDAVVNQIQYELKNSGDLVSHTGNTTGCIKNCKVGDCVIELGPDSATPGERIVMEAKESGSYQLANARDEMETARKNREAQVGLFIFSKKTAPENLDPVTRLGHDVYVVWDVEDERSDLFVNVGLTLARALCVRSQQQKESHAADFSAIDQAILDIEKKALALDDVETWTKTIQNNSEKILKKITLSRKTLIQQVEVLREKTADLKGAFSNGENE